MVHAFIMVKTGPGESQDVVDRVRDLAAVREAHVVAGEYDIIAEVNADEIYEILKTASAEIQGLGGVTDTKTYIALD